MTERTKRYVHVALKPGGKTYVYHNDEAGPLNIGDTVRIVAPHGGTLDVPVLDITDILPPWPTKPATKI